MGACKFAWLVQSFTLVFLIVDGMLNSEEKLAEMQRKLQEKRLKKEERERRREIKRRRYLLELEQKEILRKQ